MAFEIGTASNYLDLWKRVNHFICGHPTQSAVTGTRAGNGTLTSGLASGVFRDGNFGLPAAVTETWTLTCTVAAANGGTFSVVGSVSGAQANATVGTPYDNGKIKFTINDGTVDFQVNDQFIFTLTRGAMSTAGQAWEHLGLTADGVNTFKGPGLTGTESIYMLTGTYENPGTDVYNMWYSSALGFNPLMNWNTQPGALGIASYVFCWNSATPYWIVANGQRVIVVFKVSTTYHAFHVGKILPYGLPSEYGYPVYVGGEHTSGALRWSTVNEDTRHFTDPGSACNLCFPDGNWYSISNWFDNGGTEVVNYNSHRSVWPYSAGSAGTELTDRVRSLRDNVDGTYSLLPLIISSSQPSVQILGEIDGAYWVSGYNNASENLINIGGVDYLVVQNIFRTTRAHYWALKLA